MEGSGIGQVILYYRQKYQFSQAQVCDGICSVMTMSRIENGGRECDFLVAETLLSRLGKTTEGFEFALSEEEYEQARQRHAVERHLEAFLRGDAVPSEEELRDAESELTRLGGEASGDSGLHRQLALYYHAMLQERRGASGEEVCDSLRRALRVTCPEDWDAAAQERLFGAVEVKIIYQLFVCGFYAVEQMESLLQYMEKYYAEDEKERSLVPLLYQIACRCEDAKRYREQVSYAGQAIAVINSGRSYRYLAELHFLRVRGLERLGEGSGLSDICSQIYYLYLICEDAEGMRQVEDYAQKVLGCEIRR